MLLNTSACGNSSQLSQHVVICFPFTIILFSFHNNFVFLSLQFKTKYSIVSITMSPVTSYVLTLTTFKCQTPSQHQKASNGYYINCTPTLTCGLSIMTRLMSKSRDCFLIRKKQLKICGFNCQHFTR